MVMRCDECEERMGANSPAREGAIQWSDLRCDDCRRLRDKAAEAGSSEPMKCLLCGFCGTVGNMKHVCGSECARLQKSESVLLERIQRARCPVCCSVGLIEKIQKRIDQLEEELAIYEGIHCAVCLGGLGNDEADEPKGLCSSACAESYAAQFSGDLTKQLAELREVLQASDNKNAHERAIKMRRQLESLREDRDEQKKTAEARLQQLNRQGVAFGEQLAELREENEKLRELQHGSDKIREQAIADVCKVVDQYEEHDCDDLTLAERVERLINKQANAINDVLVQRDQAAKAYVDLLDWAKAGIGKLGDSMQKLGAHDTQISTLRNMTDFLRKPIPQYGDAHEVAAAFGAHSPEHGAAQFSGPPKLVVQSDVAPERVDHPPHYQAHLSGLEAIDLCERLSFNLGNAIKYLWRAGKKGVALEDLKKARWYLERWVGQKHSLDQVEIINAAHETSRRMVRVQEADPNSPLGRVLHSLQHDGEWDKVFAVVQTAINEAQETK